MSIIAVNTQLQINPVTFRKQINTLASVKEILTPLAANDVDAIIDILDDILEKVIIIEEQREINEN